MQVELVFRDVIEADLANLTWTGGPAHQFYVATTLDATYRDEVALLVGEVNGFRAVAFGGVDFRAYPDAGKLWMLIVEDSWRGLGVGTELIRALEQRVKERGLQRARLQVEQDNPAARALYERLGYRPIAEETDSWQNDAGGTTTVAVTLMEHTLD